MSQWTTWPPSVGLRPASVKWHFEAFVAGGRVREREARAKNDAKLYARIEASLKTAAEQPVVEERLEYSAPAAGTAS